MTAGKHLLIWICGLFVVLLIAPLIQTPNGLWSNAMSELAMIRSAFGERDTYKLSKSATEIYNAVFEDSGAAKTSKKAEVSESERNNADPLFGAGGRVVTGVTNNYVSSLSVVFFVLVLRILIVLSWLPFIVPFLLAVIVEGVVRRKIKMSAIGGPNAIKFALSKHLLIDILFFPLAYLVFPFAFTPLFMPIWTLVVAWPLVVLIANIMPAGAD